MWLYGSGFPKSLNIGLAIDKKNGVESEVIGEINGAKNNADNSNASSFIKGKVGYKPNFIEKKATNEWKGWGTTLKPSFEPIIVARKPLE
jgi:site-specific DNA-methyltransferase (adenine-specific)